MRRGGTSAQEVLVGIGFVLVFVLVIATFVFAIYQEYAYPCIRYEDYQDWDRDCYTTGPPNARHTTCNTYPVTRQRCVERTVRNP